MILYHTACRECGTKFIRKPDRYDTIYLQTTSPKSKLHGVEII